MKQNCACLCGAARFVVDGDPIGRCFCHWGICQQVYRKPYSDVTYFWSRAVARPDSATVEFRRFRPPPALDRGICHTCGNPVVGLMKLGPVALAFAPSQNFENPAELPPVARHIFYDRRVADVPDSIPKASGYLMSEAYVTRTAVADLLGFRRAE